MCVEWFQGKNLALSMGISISISRMGSILSFTTEASIASWTGNYQYALWMAFLICIFSMATVVLFVVMDRRAKKHIEDKTISVQPLTIDVTAFSLQYWLWVTIAVAIYSTIFPFRAIASEHLSHIWGYSPERAGLVLSIIDITSLVFSPLFGWIVDFTGKRGILVIVGNIIAVMGYLILAYSVTSPVVGISMLGMHFALMPAAIWPCVPLIVKSKSEGLAFAIVSALINASLTGMIPLAGAITDVYGWFGLNILFSFMAGISVMVAVLWNIIDMRSSNPVLNIRVMETEKIC